MKARRDADVAVLPLALFQPNDPVQLDRLADAIATLPDSVHYYLRQHIFPALMNFQETKISACGHDLGSSILFGSRIGFSGTPSNLLPLDLGDCHYEPESDGRVISVLTDPTIVTSELKPDWTAQSLLRDIASAGDSGQPVHALIDTGALITGMDNLAVAQFLLQLLPASTFDGVVYLDAQDRQMILLRSSGRSAALSQIGLPPERRFTFYDQVHTTGMDIKQGPSARAVVTIGKDMTFRDYAQGAYRMRQIGVGQTLHLYLIPEVVNRMDQDLTAAGTFDRSGASGSGGWAPTELDVPAWLLLNSMRMESLQYVQLATQELGNVWRKHALHVLAADCIKANGDGPGAAAGTTAAAVTEPMRRLYRFHDEDAAEQAKQKAMTGGEKDKAVDEAESKGDEMDVELSAPEPLRRSRSDTLDGTSGATRRLRDCVGLFREPLGQIYDIEEEVPRLQLLADKIKALVDEHTTFAPSGSVGAARVAEVQAKIRSLAVPEAGEGAAAKDDGSLGTLVVNEAEAEAEEEAEEEAEQEEQKMSAYSRDDECPNPWKATCLRGEKAARAASARAITARGGAVTQSGAGSGSADDSPFYPLHSFRVRTEQPALPFPSKLIVSDNYFRPRWVGLGDRRLKNVALVVEWCPGAARHGMQRKLRRIHTALVASGENPNNAAALALRCLMDPKQAAIWEAKAPPENDDPNLQDMDYQSSRFLAVVSLAEGETLRRLMHTERSQPALDKSGCGLALRTIETMTPIPTTTIADDAAALAASSASSGLSVGAADKPSVGDMKVADEDAAVGDMALLDSTQDFRVPTAGSKEDDGVRIAHQCLRFLNGDMYYTGPELDLLLEGLRTAPIPDRAAFFGACQRLRRRERQVWGDTPLAKLFTAESDWHLLHVKALIQQMSSELQRRKATAKDLFERFGEGGAAASATDEVAASGSTSGGGGGEDGDMVLAGLQRLCAALHLGFSPADVALIAQSMDSQGKGRTTCAEFAAFFGLPVDADPMALDKAKDAGEDEGPKTWMCSACGSENLTFDMMCGTCGSGWTGRRECPPDSWECSVDRGGCSFFNPKTQYYCDMCNRARPDLGTVRF
mmetsp:Transcript_34135/g.89813  ORF Transcript_34135/g.89813 Transcript_34135/m.89813 type:complete len:1087 (-) Transcript_34135:500-3760(-)